MQSICGKRVPVALAICYLVAFLIGCDSSETVNITGPGGQGSVTITQAGTCRGGSSIVCADTSTAVPADAILVVTFFLRNAAGDTIATGTIPNGCATAAQLVPCEIEFSGVANGTYSVLHSVTPNNGGQPATRIYRDLIVSGVGSVTGGIVVG